ncbi:hypothetical protein DB30_04214 [Enhygromyxa salina]|uniref:Transglutaminase-like domain-containing protein n=1 Tax=Enhygromyxa salina TaxID=215803 RepID=A0A0C2D0J7_9BACT|nr:hypothetical protein [Enhygromyxa salina]KIG16741.1 hypothetical protein DB30_04214 [Enhygromyxa salina]
MSIILGLLLSGLLGAACMPEPSAPPPPLTDTAGSATTLPPDPTSGSEPELEPAQVVAEVEAEPKPPPPPPPPPFVDRERVRVDELLAAITEEVPGVANSPEVRADYQAFLTAFEIEHLDDPEIYLDYVRVKIAFEATRAGGWWGLKWDITNEQPNSDKVWAHWKDLELGTGEGATIPETTAVAECDELSALFAFVAKRIGLSRRSEVGLLWPTGNHTVAVWTIDRKGDAPTRIIVPTSQIFLNGDQSLGTQGFDAWKQKSIFDYRRQDAAGKLQIPAALANHFVMTIREYGGRSQAVLQDQRNDKEDRQ